MRKKIISGSYQKQEILISNNWLNIENVAEVEITSENERPQEYVLNWYIETARHRNLIGRLLLPQPGQSYYCL
jgi:hypothetical protein